MSTRTRARRLVLPLESVTMRDVPLVGGKNASLGEMIRTVGKKGVRVPGGFVITATAYREFIQSAGLESFIRNTLRGLDTSNVRDLARRGKKIRDAIARAPFPEELQQRVTEAYRKMERAYGRNVDVAVRSSATAEDLPGASFAGEHETYLGIRGVSALLRAAKLAMASLFTDRAISYRVDKGFSHFQVALSVGVQKMVRSDLGAAGVMFTLDTESGFRDVILINGSWGLGEMIVQGQVTPDEFLVYKPMLGKSPRPIIEKLLGRKLRKMRYAIHRHGAHTTRVVATTPRERTSFVLSDDEILLLASWGKIIEEHYSRLRGKWTPMDIEWAKDGKSGELFIVQARPETVHAERDFSKVQEYVRLESGNVIVRGASVGNKIASGKARVILNVADIGKFRKGEVLVTDMTDPDWEPVMKIASAIVTDKGGRTSHAAIVSRELGIPCVVGSGDATKKITTGEVVTVDTTGSEGLVFAGALKFRVRTHDVRKMPRTRTTIMMNIATPETAFEKSFLPARGVGLAREEFIIAGRIGIHPLALLHFKELPASLQRKITKKTAGWDDKVQFYVDNLAFGIARIGAAFFPHKVIVRFSDFKTNEYRTLLGGEYYEPKEENPMIGWRGASRYYSEPFRDAFLLECLALKKVRDEMGLVNVVPMVPFCRTPEEGIKTLECMAEVGLITAYVARKRRMKVPKGKLVPVYVMCEIPSNVMRAEEFLDVFDGMSIGSNDLTQLTLGMDRDSALLRGIANENDPAVKRLIAEVIRVARARKKYIGICGQAPSDYPEFTRFLIDQGIESISLNPDTVVATLLAVAQQEKKQKGRRKQKE